MAKKKVVKKSKPMKKDKDPVGSSLFVGSLMFGLALGLYFGQISVGILGGLGVGFILKAISLSDQK